MAAIIGNTSPGMVSVGTGSGRPHQRAPFTHLTIAGEIGDVIRIPATDLFPKAHQVFQGIFAQTTVGGVQIDTTLADVDLAMNPEQDGAIWIADTTLAVGSITKLTHFATAIRITFTAAAVVYLAGV